MAEENNGTDQIEFTIHRGRLDSLTVYEITDHELENLEKWSQNSIDLNLAILFLSVGAAFATTLVSTDVRFEAVFWLFVVLSVGGIVGGLIYLKSWHNTRGSLTVLSERIRNRMNTRTNESRFRDLEKLIVNSMVAFNLEYDSAIKDGTEFSEPSRAIMQEMMSALERFEIPYPEKTHANLRLWRLFLPTVLAKLRSGNIDEVRNVLSRVRNLEA